MGGQNARISKRSAAGRERWSISAAGVWRLRVRSVWVARVQGFPSVLQREGSAGVFQLGWGQYGWPECKDFQAFCGGKDGLVDFRCRVVAA